jgi:hypothetical protein
MFRKTFGMVMDEPLQFTDVLAQVRSLTALLVQKYKHRLGWVPAAGQGQTQRALLVQKYKYWLLALLVQKYTYWLGWVPAAGQGQTQSADLRGRTQFTCFTGTKVQILTQKALLAGQGQAQSADLRGRQRDRYSVYFSLLVHFFYWVHK